MKNETWWTDLHTVRGLVKCRRVPGGLLYGHDSHLQFGFWVPTVFVPMSDAARETYLAELAKQHQRDESDDS